MLLGEFARAGLHLIRWAVATGSGIISAAAHDFTQIGAVNIKQGDTEGLLAALAKIGVPDAEITGLTRALKGDATAVGAAPNFGRRTATWLKGLGPKLAKAGVQIGTETVKAEAMKLISQYLGLSRRKRSARGARRFRHEPSACCSR